MITPYIFVKAGVCAALITIVCWVSWMFGSWMSHVGESLTRIEERLKQLEKEGAQRK